MMPRQKHDNNYYLRKLRDKHEDLHSDVLAGKLSVAEARKLAGLGGARTRLHELKNAWTKATPQERSDFLSFARLGPATALAAGAAGSAFDTEGIMLDWARRRIPEIIARRDMKSADLAEELGLKRSDTSVMMAIRRDYKLASNTATEVDRWLMRNAGV